MILVTGAKGQVGQCFQEAASKMNLTHSFIFADVEELDITNAAAVRQFFKNYPDLRWVINCAAYTAVDKAETEVALAKKINYWGVRNLATACAIADVPLVHLSTDYVYHNRQNTPFVEGDTVSPKSIYAKTKLWGDNAALKIHPKTIILRTSWVCSHLGNNFVKTMLRLGNERPELRVVFDQIGTPTFAPDIVQAVLDIIQKIENQSVITENDHWGIFHFSNEGVTSWYDFATEIMRLAHLPCRVLPIRSADYPTPAQRPPFSVLDKSKIKKTFGLEIPHWQSSLQQCLFKLGIEN